MAWQKSAGISAPVLVPDLPYEAALGREIRYVPLEVAQSEQGLAQLLGPEAAAGVAGIYRYSATGRAGDPLAPSPAVVESAPGVRLTPVTEWVKAQPGDHWARSTG